MNCFRSRIAAFAALLACIVPASVLAQSTRSYAVLSLATDKINVIEHVLVTGSRIDRNNRQQINVADDTFEVAVLRAVRDSLPRADEVALFSTRDPHLFALQDRALESGEPPHELVSAVAELVAKSNATHLILITKHLSDVSMELHNGSVGDGKLSGLGFYVDRDMRIRDLNTGASSIGFLAPFASMEVTLIDTRSLQTLRHVHAIRAKVYESAVSPSAAATWDILTPSQKITGLVEVTEAALHEAVPKVVSED